MIPEAAVEAAVQRSWHLEITTSDVREILEAAAPHMHQAFFLEMNLRAVEAELKTPFR